MDVSSNDSSEASPSYSTESTAKPTFDATEISFYPETETTTTHSILMSNSAGMWPIFGITCCTFILIALFCVFCIILPAARRPRKKKKKYSDGFKQPSGYYDWRAKQDGLKSQ